MYQMIKYTMCLNTYLPNLFHLIFSLNNPITNYQSVLQAMHVFSENSDLFCFAPPPSLVSMNFLWPPGARAIFLHSNVLYNNI